MSGQPVPSILEMSLRLVLSVILGGVVGWEREVHGRPAGLRTHILVCMGAAIFTMVSVAFTGERSDPSRIASQVVTGIGFLGAGTIIRQGSVVRGLTTAASLWTVAAIGVAVGTGGALYYLAIIGTAVVFATLGVINRIEHQLIAARRPRELVVTARGPEERICPIIEAAMAGGAEVASTRSEPAEEPETRIYRLRLKFPHSADPAAVVQNVSGLEGVLAVEWD